MTPVCSGAGAEVDSCLRDMPVILSLLTGGGYRLSVEASSPSWDINLCADHLHSTAVGGEGVEASSLCSAGGMEVRIPIDALTRGGRPGWEVAVYPSLRERIVHSES